MTCPRAGRVVYHPPVELSRKRRKNLVEIDYAEVRGKIRDGDIVLFRGRSLVSRWICWVTGSKYSHAGVVGWWNNHLMVLEAVPKGVVATRLSAIVNGYPGSAELWTTDKDIDREEIVRAAQLLLGRGYSMMKAFAMGRRIIYGGMKGKDPDQSPDGFLCSEFVSRVWRAGGLDLKEDAPDRFTKPKDIATSIHLRKIGDLVPPKKAAALPAGSSSTAIINHAPDTLRPKNIDLSARKSP